jgi:CheY-like chemotaxis protein
MPNVKPTLLIVDDEESIRTSLSQVFTEFGHSVRAAADGFAALTEIRREVPDILISDLNMPRMSGFELLSVVRRRFPAIRVIAMSGAFSSDEALSCVAADAFYRKGSGLGELLRTMGTPPWPERRSQQHTNNSAPIWIQKSGHDASGVAFAMIACPECLRTFSQSIDNLGGIVRETDCAHCHCLIHYAIVIQIDAFFSQAFRLGIDTPTSLRGAHTGGQYER